MDIRSLKQQSDLSYDIAVAKRNALEKANSRMVMAYNGNLFRADANTTDADNFLERLIERNQEALNAYHQMYETFTKKGD